MTSRSPPVVSYRSSGGREPTPILTRRFGGGGVLCKSPQANLKNRRCSRVQLLKNKTQKRLKSSPVVSDSKIIFFFHAMLCLKEKKSNRPWTTCFIALSFFLLNFIFPFLGTTTTTTTNSCTFDRKQKIPFFPTLRKETTGAQVDVRLWPLEGNRRHVWADTSGSLTQ